MDKLDRKPDEEITVNVIVEMLGMGIDRKARVNTDTDIPAPKIIGAHTAAKYAVLEAGIGEGREGPLRDPVVSREVKREFIRVEQALVLRFKARGLIPPGPRVVPDMHMFRWRGDSCSGGGGRDGCGWSSNCRRRHR